LPIVHERGGRPEYGLDAKTIYISVRVIIIFLPNAMWARVYERTRIIRRPRFFVSFWLFWSYLTGGEKKRKKNSSYCVACVHRLTRRFSPQFRLVLPVRTWVFSFINIVSVRVRERLIFYNKDVKITAERNQIDTIIFWTRDFQRISHLVSRRYNIIFLYRHRILNIILLTQNHL